MHFALRLSSVFEMRLKVELFSTFQRKARRRTAHQCNTRPRQVAHAAPLPTRRPKQPGDPANVLPAALCQGVFEASAVFKTRWVCFGPMEGCRNSKRDSSDERDIRKFSCHSSGRTTSFSKFSHQTAVRPGRIQNRRWTRWTAIQPTSRE